MTVLALVVLAVGGSLVFGEVAWFRRVPLVERLRPFHPAAPARRRPRLVGASSFAEVLGPVVRRAGGTLARTMGAREDATTRLKRIHSPLDEAGWRLRQGGWVVAALTAGLAVEAVARAPWGVGLLLVGGAPMLAFLLVEQGLARASSAHQDRLFHELPVTVEQMAMLVAAGYSLGAALDRIAARGRGLAAADLGAVMDRVRTGAGLTDSLRDWAALARVDAVDRLVAVLTHSGDAPDLGRLLAAEGASIRAEAQRRVLEVMERRAQQVWVPVTVAALVPGALFLAVPFVHALSLYAGG